MNLISGTKRFFTQLAMLVVAVFIPSCSKQVAEFPLIESPSSVQKTVEHTRSHHNCEHCKTHIVAPDLIAAHEEAQALPEAAVVAENEVRELHHQSFNHYQAGDRVQIDFGDKGSFVGRILRMPSLEAATVNAVGVLEGEQGGEFLFRPIKGGRLRGQMRIPSQAKGYVFTINQDGSIVHNEMSIDSLPTVCPLTPEMAAKAYTEDGKFLILASPAEGGENDPQPAPWVTPDVPKLNSLPGASTVIYIDFDGESLPNSYVTDTSLWNDGNPLEVRPFMGASGEFTDYQLQVIYRLWSQVAEDFLPFNINVTTELSVYLAAATDKRIQCVVTPDWQWRGHGGGVAGGNTFHSTGNGDNKVCWTMQNDEQNTGQVISHEVGHTFGIWHDGLTADGNGLSSYYLGHGDGVDHWGPIMGSGYTSRSEGVFTWSLGEYYDANNPQDDLDIITASGQAAGYRADDHGNNNGSASNLLGDEGSKSYKIYVGNYYRGSMSKLFFAAGDSVGSGANSVFKNIRIYEDGSVLPSYLNFGSYTLESYADGGSGTANLQNGNVELHMDGNLWRAIPFNYTITKDTIIEFEFESSSEGEVHAIGFDNDAIASPERAFQMFGTEDWGLVSFREFAVPTRRYHDQPYHTGIIERNTDVDVFRVVNTNGGAFTLDIEGSQFNTRTGNLNIKADLYSSGGALIKTSNNTGTLDAAISHTSNPGEVFYLHITGTGEGTPLNNPPSGYTDYASLGHYHVIFRGLDPLTPDPITWSAQPAEGDVAPLNILSAGTLAGNNPRTGQPWAEGDFYRLAFVTSTQRDAASHDIADYNAFVQSVAEASSLDLTGPQWFAIGSTGSIDAYDNTETNPSEDGAGVPIYLVDGSTLIADGNAELWNGAIDAPINIDENGTGGYSVSAATGSNSNGTARTQHLGGDSTPRVEFGNSSHSGGTWALVFGGNPSSNYNFYALSEPIPIGLYIQMEANVVTGGSGSIEYYFEETSGNPGGTDSGWQSSPVYIDGGLVAGNTYTYRVKARDANLTISETGYSSSVSVAVAVDNTAPQLSDIADNISGSSFTEGGSITYTVSFNENINASSVSVADFEISGTASASIDSVTATGDAKVFTVVASASSTGSFRLQIKSGAVIQDSAGNGLDTSSAIQDDVDFTVIADVPELVSITDDQSGTSLQHTDTVIYTVSFDEAINASSITTADFEINGTAGGMINSVNSTGDAAVFAVSATPVGGGTFTLRIKAGAVIQDLDGYSLDTSSAISDDVVFNVTAPDTTAPQVTSITDNVPSQFIWEDGSVTYTVTFNEPMNGSTISTADFRVTGTAGGTIDSVSVVSTSVYTIVASPTGAGTMLFELKQGASLTDTAGNALDTSSAIQDSETIIVNAGNQPPTLITGGNDSWNTAVNWDTGSVPSGTVNASIAAGVSGQVGNVATPTWDGSLTMLNGSSLVITNTSSAENAIQGATVLNLANASVLLERQTTLEIAAINVSGASSITSAQTSAHDRIRNFNGAIAGSGSLSVDGVNKQRFYFKNANSLTGGLLLEARDRYEVFFNVAGSAGNGVVTVTPRSADGRSAVVIINASGALQNVTTLTLNGSGWNNSSGGNHAGSNYKIVMNADDTVSALVVDSSNISDGTYSRVGLGGGHNEVSWISGNGVLTVDGTAPSAYSAWSSGFGGLSNDDATADFDGDGLETGVEWVLGGDPSDESDGTTIKPTWGHFFLGGYVYAYRRSDDAYNDPNTTIIVEYSNDLQNWTTAVHNGSTISFAENDDAISAGIDQVLIVFSSSLVTGDGLFVRLRVEVNE